MEFWEYHDMIGKSRINLRQSPALNLPTLAQTLPFCSPPQLASSLGPHTHHGSFLPPGGRYTTSNYLPYCLLYYTPLLSLSPRELAYHLHRE